MAQMVSIHGMTVSVENPKGSVRSGMGPNGSWSTALRHDYGDIVNPGHTGADGDPVDVFLGDAPESDLACVINQVHPDGSFDEHKVMLGFASEDEAKSAYLSNYEAGWTGMGSAVSMPVGSLITWLHTGDLTQPATVPGSAAGLETHVLTETHSLTDAGEFSFEDAVLTQVQTEDAVRGAAERGPIRLLASPARVKNENRRFFEPDFLRAAAQQGDAYCKATPRYGEEPHPPFDASRGQYVTDSSNEVWRQDGWTVDAAGNLVSLNTPDPRTPKGRRVQQKLDDREKIGGSVRWWADRSAPLRRLTDGSEIQHFGAEMIGHAYPMVFDHVPNPAFVEAGRVLDAGQMIAMTDATHPLPTAELSSELPSEASPVLSEAVPTEDARQLLPAPPPDFAPPQRRIFMLKTLADLRKSAADATDPNIQQAYTDAADALETQQAQAQQDAETLKADILAETKTATQAMLAQQTDAQVQEKLAAEERTKVLDLADAAESGAAAETARFPEIARKEIAGRIRRVSTEAEARVALTDAVADEDRFASRITLYGGGAPGGGQAQGVAVVAAGGRAEVVADEGDKTVEAFFDSVNKERVKALARMGVADDPKLQAANKEKVDEILGPVEKRISPKALLDSVEYLTAGPDRKSQTNLRGAVRAMMDAGMMDSSVPLTDAVMNTGNFLQQPVLLQLFLRPAYQNLQGLKYVQGFGPGATANVGAGMSGFDGGAAGNQVNLGRTFRFQSRWFTPSGNSTGGRTRNSLRVGENAAVPRTAVQNSWQSFFSSRRGFGFAMTKELMTYVATGATPFNLLGETLAENQAFFMRETDNLIYFEQVSATLEMNCKTVPAGAPEAVAAGNLTNGRTQDGITYGDGTASNGLNYSPDQYPPQGIVCVCQPDCGGTVTRVAVGGTGGTVTAASVRLPENAANASTSNAYRNPLVPPREQVTVDNFNNETTTTLYPVVIKKGAAVLVEGYLTADNEIGSYGNVQADYALDYMRGKIVFSAHAGVTAATNNLTLAYSYATNFYLTQRAFGGAGYPNQQTERLYADFFFQRNNDIAAKMGSHPNYITPNISVGSRVTAAQMTKAGIFEKLRSPTGASLIDPTADTYAEYDNVMYDAINAPSILGDNAMLLCRNGFSVFAIDSLLHVEGGFAGYDPATGQLAGRTEYMMNQFDTFCTPLARDRNQVVFNVPSTLHILI